MEQSEPRGRDRGKKVDPRQLTLDDILARQRSKLEAMRTQQAPSPAELSNVEIWWCPPGQSHLVWLLGDPDWWLLHWRFRPEQQKKRSTPCLGGVPDCRLCCEGWPVRWFGYASALLRVEVPRGSGQWRWKPVVAEVTQDTSHVFESRRLAEHLLVFTRSREGRGPLCLDVQRDQEQEVRPALPPKAKRKPFDVLPVCMRAWEIVSPPPSLQLPPDPIFHGPAEESDAEPEEGGDS